jgi:hypothetical protein
MLSLAARKNGKLSVQERFTLLKEASVLWLTGKIDTDMNR